MQKQLNWEDLHILKFMVAIALSVAVTLPAFGAVPTAFLGPGASSSWCQRLRAAAAADIVGRMDHAIGMTQALIPEVSTGGQGTTAGAVRTVLVTAGSLKVPSKRTRADRACASPIEPRR
jgi:hypothetical protein